MIDLDRFVNPDGTMDDLLAREDPDNLSSYYSSIDLLAGDSEPGTAMGGSSASSQDDVSEEMGEIGRLTSEEGQVVLRHLHDLGSIVAEHSPPPDFLGSMI